MFLPWLDQIVTYYRHNESISITLGEIIYRLIQDYPEAFQLQYPDVLKKFVTFLLLILY